MLECVARHQVPQSQSALHRRLVQKAGEISGSESISGSHCFHDVHLESWDERAFSPDVGCRPEIIVLDNQLGDLGEEAPNTVGICSVPQQLGLVTAYDDDV